MYTKLRDAQIQYIEFTCTNFDAIKHFYGNAFKWTFTDYGPDYIGFEGEYVDGGFYIGEVQKGSILPILYAENLESLQAAVQSAGGVIMKDIFSFPGGRRFHFSDPAGNELAVWSDN